MIRYYLKKQTKDGVIYIPQETAWNKYLKYVNSIIYYNSVNYLLKPKKPLSFEMWLNSKEKV